MILLYVSSVGSIYQASAVLDVAVIGLFGKTLLTYEINVKLPKRKQKRRCFDILDHNLKAVLTSRVWRVKWRF